MTPPADVSKPFVASESAAEAVRMLEAFASIGATHFDITHTNLDGEKRGFRGNRSLDEVRRSMPHLLASAVQRQNNVIVRPRVQGWTCIQLDDLDRAKAATIAPAAFLILETSPGNYQAWVAVADAGLGITSRLRKGAGADLNASGATRVAGTHNFKPKYAPDFPVVRIAAKTAGRVFSVAQLDRLGVLAPEPPRVEPVPPGGDATRRNGPARTWPDYGRVLAGAPIGPSGHPQRTSVDFTWCMTAISWGHSVEATAGRLMTESTKADENGAEYARRTAERAAWAAARRQRPTGPRP